MGISNTVATIPGVIANVLAGGMLASLGDWRPVFGLAVLMLGGGLVAFLGLAKGEPVFRSRRVEWVQLSSNDERSIASDE